MEPRLKDKLHDWSHLLDSYFITRRIISIELKSYRISLTLFGNAHKTKVHVIHVHLKIFLYAAWIADISKLEKVQGRLLSCGRISHQYSPLLKWQFLIALKHIAIRSEIFYRELKVSVVVNRMLGKPAHAVA